MKFNQLILIFIFIFLNFSNFVTAQGKYNISFAMLDKCKMYDAVNGYNYKTYFHLSDLKHVTPQDDELIKINIYVLGSKDAHILFSPTSAPDPDTPVYEIGAGANTFCEIRKKRKSNPLKTKRLQILSVIDPVPITIRITRSGLIEVSIPGDILPLISAEDPDPILDLKYLLFSTWGSTSVRFFYDCPDMDGQELTPDPPPMTTQERLIKDIFANYDTFALPQLTEEVMIDTFTIKSVDYNEQKSLLSTRAKIKLSWNDSRLMWDPLDYENIKGLRNPSKASFWRPSLMLMNGVLETFKNLDIQYTFTLKYDGTITAESKEFEMTTLCFPGSGVQLHDWPSTEMGCYIQVMTQTESLAGFEDSIKLELDRESAWTVTKVFEDDDYVVNHIPFIEFESLTNLDGKSQTPRMCVSYIIYLKQNQSYFKMLFQVTLFSSLICLVLGAVSSKTYRFAFISISMIIISISMMSLGNFAPKFYKSTFAIDHESLMYLTWISIVFAIINIWCYEHPPETLPPMWIGIFINFYWTRQLIS
uniref:CSON008575 protein n=2 Tax=Culicoides sonorensis TaxID=179676 RepID=A0A336N7Y6_CULSO